MAARRPPPGPTLPVAAQTALWMVRQWAFLDRCAARYGDMFTLRIASAGTWVVVSHPDAVKQVFTGSAELLHAGEGNEVLLPVLGSHSVLVLDEEPHREQRRVLLPPFRARHVRGYDEMMTTIAAKEISNWPRGEPVPLLPRMRTLTLEIILRTVFGLDEGERLDRLRAALARLLDTVSGFGGQFAVAVLGPRRLQRFGPMRAVLTTVDRLIYAEINDRRSRENLDEREDALSILLRAVHEDGRPLSDVELRDELMTLLAAGHETTAGALSWAVERLVRHRDKHQRLTDEVRAGSHEYRDAVVQETLRMRPVVSIVQRRLTEPMEIGGWPLPAGVYLAPSIYLVHRRPDIYPDPGQFRPERFVGERPGRYTWIPFGGGVRRCLGAAFAEYEMRVVLAALFGGERIRPVVRDGERPRRRGVTIVPNRRVRVVLG